MTREEAIKHLKLMQSGAKNAIRFTKNDKEISEEERKEDIEIYQDQLVALNMAINFLEQEPCEDVISRQAVLEYIEGSDAELGHSSENEIVCQDIKELPSVTPTTTWIPVSERLPEVGEKVLCQCQANIYEVLKLTVDGWYHDNKHCYMSGFVIAWMPLPDLYNTEMEGEE